MATNVFDLVATLSLDSSKYVSGLNQAKGIGGAFGNALGTAARVGLTAVTAATTAVVGFGATSVKAGGDFDKSMSQVAATMGVTTDQIGNLRDFAQEMGSTTAFSATQSADALNYMALAGYDAETSMAMLPNVLNLAAAGGIDLASASDMVTDAQSALGLSLDDTSTMVDQMAKTSSKSNTSVAQLGEAFLTIGATARNLAGGTTELSTVLGVLADNGIKGAEGGTHLRNMLLALQTPTKDGTAALAQLGMTYDDMYDSAGNMRALPEIMLQLQTGMEGMTQASKDAIISGIFNKTDLAAANALIGTSKERFDELTGSIDNATGAAQQMADTQLANLQGDVTLFQSALEGAQIVISDALNPTLRKFVQFGTDGLSKLTSAFKDGGLNGAMTALGEILSKGLNLIIASLPQMINAGMQLLGALGQGLLDNLPTIVDAASQIIMMLLQGLMQALPRLAEGAIQIVSQLATGIGEMAPIIIPDAVNAIIDTIIALLENADALVDGAIALMEGLSTGLVNAIPVLLERLPEILMALVDAIITSGPELMLMAANPMMAGLASGLLDNIPSVTATIPQIMDAIISAFEPLVSGLMESVQGAYNAVNEWWAGVVTWFEELGNQIIEFFRPVTETLLSIWNDFVEMITPLLDAFRNLFETIFEAIKIVTDRAFNAVKDKVLEVWNGITEETSKWSKGIETSVTDTWNNLIEGVTTFFAPIKEKIENIWTSIIDSAKEWGRDVLESFADGISDGINFITDALNAVSQAIKDLIGFSEPKKGPLSNFHTYAPDMMKLFAQGVKNNTGIITSQIKDSFNFGHILSDSNLGTNSSYSNGYMHSDKVVADGFVQNLVINSPKQLDPSEIARQTRNANREFVLQLRTV